MKHFEKYLSEIILIYIALIVYTNGINLKFMNIIYTKGIILLSIIRTVNRYILREMRWLGKYKYADGVSD